MKLIYPTTIATNPTKERSIITEQHPVIVKIISDRKKAVVVGFAASALAALNTVLVDAPLWLVAVPSVFVLMVAIDIWCIRQRVRSGAYGDNLMEVSLGSVCSRINALPDEANASSA
jgi:hypothetical protein